MDLAQADEEREERENEKFGISRDMRENFGKEKMVQKSYNVLQKDGFIETTAGKGCFVSVQNQDFYLEEQQKKIENYFIEAIEIAKVSGIKLDKLQSLLALLYEEE